MSIERSERRVFRHLDSAIHEIELAMENLEDSVEMSYSKTGAKLAIELMELTTLVAHVSYRIRQYTAGERVEFFEEQ